jgi:hypothetical protein
LARRPPDRVIGRVSAATLKPEHGPADQRLVHPPQRFLLPSAALATLAILVVVLFPGRAGADFHGPKARTGPATAITDTTATLSGFVQTGGRDTVWFFEYGPTMQYGAETLHVRLPKNGTGPVSAVATALVPSTLYHYRLVAFHPGRGFDEVDRGADQTFTTTAPPAPAPVAPLPAPAGPAQPPATAPPAAALGASVVVAPVTGTVLVKVPGAAGFAPLGASTSVPTGAVLDTREGRVALTTALPGGRTQTATFERGVFQVRQPASGRGFTDIILRGPALDCSGSARSTARAAAVTKRKRKKRQLWGRDRGGRFRTHGNNSVATVRGTSWITTDTCNGTRTTVKAGAVSVRDVHRHRTVLVRAGHTYLARRR